MTQITYAYEKLLKEYNLSISDLPADAQTGIKQIKSIAVALDLQNRKAAKQGKEFAITSSTANKIKTFDKWVVRDILDYVEDKEANTDAPPVEAEEIIEEIKNDSVFISSNVEVLEEKVDVQGITIDEEFEAIIKTKTEFTLEELKSDCPTAYSLVFLGYKQGEENGVVTTYHSLIEKDSKFTLTKK